MGPTRFGSLLLGATVAFVCLVGILAGRVQAEEPPPGLVWEARYNRPYSEDDAVRVLTTMREMSTSLESGGPHRIIRLRNGEV